MRNLGKFKLKLLKDKFTTNEQGNSKNRVNIFLYISKKLVLIQSARERELAYLKDLDNKSCAASKRPDLLADLVNDNDYHLILFF